MIFGHFFNSDHGVYRSWSWVTELVSHAVPVLATMILLSYTKLIRTVFQALYFVNIQCNGNNNVTFLRWYIDANVQYVGSYCYLRLFLFSLVVLILLIVPYTFYLLTISIFEGHVLLPKVYETLHWYI